MYFDDLKIGMTVEISPAVIEKEKMMAFARDYDNIPLHTDEEYAKTTPFGKLIAPGMMSFMSVWAKYLEVDFFGKELLAGKSSKIEWLKPVYADDVLTGKATLTNLTRRNEKNGIVEITIDAYNQNGELVLTNITEAIVKCKTTKKNNEQTPKSAHCYFIIYNKPMQIKFTLSLVECIFYNLNMTFFITIHILTIFVKRL